MAEGQSAGRPTTQEVEHVEAGQPECVEVADRLDREAIEPLEDRRPALGRVPAEEESVQEPRPAALTLLLRSECPVPWTEESSLRKTRDQGRESYGDREGVPRAGVKPPPSVPGPKRPGALRFEGPVPGHGQNAFLFAEEARHGPASLVDVPFDLPAKPGPVECRRVAEAGVFDEECARTEGEEVEEAIPVALVDARIHEHGTVEPVRFGEFDFVPDELLKACRGGRSPARTARIDDEARLDLAAVGGAHATLLEHGHLRVEEERTARRLLDRPAHDVVQPSAGETEVRLIHDLLAAGETNPVPRPAVLDERLEPTPVRLVHVRRMEAPRMIPTERRPALDQEEARIGSPGSECERDQPALEPAAHEDVVESVHGAEHVSAGGGTEPPAAFGRWPSAILLAFGLSMTAPMAGESARAIGLIDAGPAAYGVAAPASGVRAVEPQSVEAQAIDTVADEDPFAPAGLGEAPFGEMEALLEVTLFNIDVLTLTVRVPDDSAARLEALVADADGYEDELADSVGAIVFDADALWSRQEFERDVGYGRLIGAMEDSAEDAVKAGYITEAYAAEFAASLPELFGFLEDDGVKEGDQIYMLVRGDTVRTLFRTVDGRVLLDRSATSAEGRNGSIPTFFAPDSDFRKRLVESLLAERVPSE